MQAGDCKDQPFSPPKFLQIKQDDILFPNQSSKDHNSKDEASFRVLYYGGASGTVPFTWETRPGTPKHPLFEDNSLLPPLTPPPSYLSTPKINKNRNPKIFNLNFFRHYSKSNKEKSLFSLSSDSSSSSNSAPSMSVYARSIDHYSFNKDKKTPEKSSVTPLCFGGSGNRTAGGNFGIFRRRVKSVKNAFLLIGGSGTEPKF